MQKSLKWVAIALLAIGVVLAWVGFSSTSKVKPALVAKTVEAAPKKHPVLVVRHTVEAGQLLSHNDVQVKELEQLPLGAFEHASAVVGRVITQPLVEGEVVTANMLLSGMAGQLQAGERAIAIKVDESTAVGHKLQPGDWVDVLVVFRKDGQEVMDTQSRRLLERKRVLAYGMQVDVPQPVVHQPVAAASDEEKTVKSASKAVMSSESVRNNTARTAVLAVHMDEINALLLAERQGQVMLALRSPLEPVTAEKKTDSVLPEAAATLVAASAGADKAAVPAHELMTLNKLAQTGDANDARKGAKPLLAAKASAPAAPQAVKVVHRKPAEKGLAVEMIRGNRAETVHY